MVTWHLNAIWGHVYKDACATMEVNYPINVHKTYAVNAQLVLCDIDIQKIIEMQKGTNNVKTNVQN